MLAGVFLTNLDPAKAIPIDPDIAAYLSDPANHVAPFERGKSGRLSNAQAPSDFHHPSPRASYEDLEFAATSESSPPSTSRTLPDEGAPASDLAEIH